MNDNPAPRRYVGDAFDQSSDAAWDRLEQLRPRQSQRQSPAVSLFEWAAEWRRILLPIETIATSFLRALAGIGFLALEPLATAIDPLLGKVSHGAGILFVMLALWSIVIPIESAIVAPLAKRLGAWVKRAIVSDKEGQ